MGVLALFQGWVGGPIAIAQTPRNAELLAASFPAPECSSGLGWIAVAIAFALGGLAHYGLVSWGQRHRRFRQRCPQDTPPSIPLFPIPDRVRPNEPTPITPMPQIPLAVIVDQAIAALASFKLTSPDSWICQYRSAGCERVFGYSAAEMIADPTLWQRCLVPEDWQAWRRLQQQIAAQVQAEISTPTEGPSREGDRGGDPSFEYQIEYRFRHRDGSLRWILETLSVYQKEQRDYSDPPQAWFVTALSIDITQRKQTEATLLENEERFRSIFESAGIGVMLTGTNRIPIQTNPAVQALLGYSDAELCQMPFTQYTHPDDIAIDVTLNEELITGQRTSYQIEKRYIHKQGSLIWARLTVSAVRGATGVIQFTLAMIQDITAQRQAEAQLQAANAEMRALFAAMNDLIFVYDRNGRNLRTLSANERLLYRSVEEKTGKTLHEIFSPNLADKFLGYIHQALNTQQTVRAEYCLPIAGEEVWSDAVLSPIDSNTVIWAIRDITQRKKFEAALLERERYLAALVEVQQYLLDLEDNQPDPHQPILELLGRVSGASRAYIFENHLNSAGELLTSQRSEWCADGVSPQIGNPDLQNMPVARVIPHWTELFSRGEVVAGNISSFPDAERSILEPREIKSILLLPLMVNGQWFGLIGFDNCYEEKVWDASEIYLLQAAAAAIALSYERRLVNRELRTTNAELNALFNAMDELILVLDAEGRHLKVRGANFQLLYKPYEERLGRTLHEIFPQAQADWFLQQVHTVLQTKQTMHVEYSLTLEHGEEVWSDASISYIDANTVIWAVRDITERKRAEEVIRQSEARFQRLAANLPGVIYRYLLRADGSEAMTYVSPASQSVYELSPEAIQDDLSLVWQMIHPDDRPQLQAAIAESATTLQPFFWEGRIITPSGQMKWIRSNFRPERQENGDIIWDGLTIDVSDRKQAEFALQRQAERERLMTQVTQRIRQTLDLEEILVTTVAEVRQFLQADRVLIYQFNPDWSGHFVAESVAPGWTPVLPLAPGEQQFYQSTVDQDTCRVQQQAKRCDRSTPRSLENYIKDTYLQQHQGGSYATGMSYFCVEDIYQQGFSDCYLQLLERFQAKAYITVPIFQNTIHGHILWGLMGTYQNTGTRSWQEDEIKFVVNIATQLGVALQQAELLAQTLQQSTELKYAKEAADAANRAKSLFLASMSHELRTPLNAILGFTQLMVNDQSMTPSQQENLTIINRSGEHLLGLINDVLDMSKIEAGKIDLVEKQVDLDDLLNGLYETFYFRANAKGIALILERSPHLPHYIQIDDGKLRQILSNLLSNAIKFTEVGQVRFTVGTLDREPLWKGAIASAPAPVEDKDDRNGSQEPHTDHASASLQSITTLFFSIEDTGPGIAKAELDTLFTPFMQTETGLRSQQGTGLGLSIAKRLVQFLGGEIGVQSELGRGTLFWVKLPVKLAPSCDLLPADSGRPVIALAPGQPTYRILVVDDARTNRLLLLRLLEPLGFEVREAANGEEAIAQWEQWQPHLIWMDMQMPGLDGYAATRQIRMLEQARQNRDFSAKITVANWHDSYSSPPATIIIALTANAIAEERAQILATGCNDILNKPFRRQALLQKIADHLGVSYVYADEQPKAVASNLLEQDKGDLPVTPHSLLAIANRETLPPGWLDQVYQAATQANARQLLQLAEMLPSHHEDLRRVIVNLVQQYRFDVIMDSARQVV